MTGSSSTDERQADIDLVVVGAGAGGMVAALVAALEGLRVVLCEGSQQVGGTTATSAGTLWIPGNRHGAEAGHADSVQAAASYLDALIGPDDGRQLRQAFLESGDAAIAYLEERTDVAFDSAGQHPDYLALPGAAIAGRALAPRPFDGRLLRGAFARIRPPMPEFLLLGGMMVGKADIQALVRRWQSWPAFVASAGLVARYLVDRIRYPRGTRLVMGNALVARLFYSLQRAGVDVRFGWRLRELTVEGGKVRGATFAVDGQERRLDSRAGVVLATGGVGHGEALRAELAPAGMSLPSLACDAVNGEGITAARSAGAGFERYAAGDFFWQPVSRVPRPGGPGLFPHLFLDRAKPGLVAVDAQGRRFADEAGSYHHFVEAMVRHLQRTGGDAAWLVCDAAFVHKYGLGVILPGTRRLDRWIRQGYVCVADRLPALAQRAGIDPAGLLATVQRTNDYAATGRDPDFHKGDAPVDRFNGDPAHRPNPCLGEIGQPPFVALRILPADAASSSGLPIDADGRVLDRAGRGDTKASAEWLRAIEALQGRSRFHAGDIAKKLGITTCTSWADEERQEEREALSADAPEPVRITYPMRDHLTATRTDSPRPGLAMILRAARDGDTAKVLQMVAALCAEARARDRLTPSDLPCSFWDWPDDFFERLLAEPLQT